MIGNRIEVDKVAVRNDAEIHEWSWSSGVDLVPWALVIIGDDGLLALLTLDKRRVRPGVDRTAFPVALAPPLTPISARYHIEATHAAALVSQSARAFHPIG